MYCGFVCVRVCVWVFLLKWFCVLFVSVFVIGYIFACLFCSFFFIVFFYIFVNAFIIVCSLCLCFVHVFIKRCVLCVYFIHVFITVSLLYICHFLCLSQSVFVHLLPPNIYYRVRFRAFISSMRLSQRVFSSHMSLQVSTLTWYFRSAVEHQIPTKGGAATRNIGGNFPH